MNTQKITKDITWVGVDDHITPLLKVCGPLKREASPTTLM